MRADDPPARLRHARGFVFDMDGTLVLGDRGGRGLRPLPGAVEIISWVTGRGLPSVVFTNGTTRTPARLAGTMREIGASQTPFFAVDGGRALGTSRAISAMITSLTGCAVRVVGKPSLDALRSAAERLGASPARLAVVGDDPRLEVPMAHRGRSLAIAVQTGLGAAAAYDTLD